MFIALAPTKTLYFKYIVMDNFTIEEIAKRFYLSKGLLEKCLERGEEFRKGKTDVGIYLLTESDGTVTRKEMQRFIQRIIDKEEKE